MLFFGDDHGREAVVGRRDAYWASGGSAVTNSLLLSAVWVVGAVFADRNAPALGGILNQQGVGNSTGATDDTTSGYIIVPEVNPRVPISFCWTFSWKTIIGPPFEWAWVEYKTFQIPSVRCYQV